MFEVIRCHELYRNTLQNTVFSGSNTFRQFRLEIRCSIQLSYGRVNLLSELTETRSCVVRLAIPN